MLFRSLSNGTTVLEYDNKPIKSNLQLITVLNDYIKSKTKYALKQESQNEDLSEFSKKLLNLLDSKIEDGKLIRTPIKLLKANKNFDRNVLESTINDFTPLKNPTVTYFFNGKPLPFKESSFQNIIDEFNTSLKYAKQRGLNALKIGRAHV